MRDLLESFLDLLYPPLCLHCQASLRKEEPLFCAPCLSQLTLINPKERCPACFSWDFSPEHRVCVHCQKKPSFVSRMASAFAYEGPAATLVRKIKYSQQPYLAKGAAAYMAAQLTQLDWPLPDVIVPVPMMFTHWLERGYNQSLLLTQSLAEYLATPYADVLHRKSGGFSQAGLTFKQRMTLKTSDISLKNAHSLQDKIVLLVDDVMTSGATLQRCAEALAAAYPTQIFALTCCKAN